MGVRCGFCKFLAPFSNGRRSHPPWKHGACYWLLGCFLSWEKGRTAPGDGWFIGFTSLFWLVVEPLLWKIFVNWGDYSQLIGKMKTVPNHQSVFNSSILIGIENYPSMDNRISVNFSPWGSFGRILNARVSTGTSQTPFFVIKLWPWGKNAMFGQIIYKRPSIPYVPPRNVKEPWWKIVFFFTGKTHFFDCRFQYLRDFCESLPKGISHQIP